MKWNKIVDICEAVIVLLLAILIVIINYKMFPPVTQEDIYNMPAEEFIRLERQIW